MYFSFIIVIDFVTRVKILFLINSSDKEGSLIVLLMFIFSVCVSYQLTEKIIPVKVKWGWIVGQYIKESYKDMELLDES